MQNQKTENTFTKKIGGATYRVRIYFNKNSTEDYNKKLLRVIKNDVADNPKAS